VNAVELRIAARVSGGDLVETAEETGTTQASAKVARARAVLWWLASSAADDDDQ
jgi:hypothetical protein